MKHTGLELRGPITSQDRAFSEFSGCRSGDDQRPLSCRQRGERRRHEHNGLPASERRRRPHACVHQRRTHDTCTRTHAQEPPLVAHTKAPGTPPGPLTSNNAPRRSLFVSLVLTHRHTMPHTTLRSLSLSPYSLSGVHTEKTEQRSDVSLTVLTFKLTQDPPPRCLLPLQCLTPRQLLGHTLRYATLCYATPHWHSSSCPLRCMCSTPPTS